MLRRKYRSERPNSKIAVLSPNSYLRLIKDESMTVSEVDDILNLEQNPWTWNQVVLKL